VWPGGAENRLRLFIKQKYRTVSPHPHAKKTSLSRAMQRKTHKEISEQAKIALSELNFRSKRIWQCTSKDFGF